MTFAVCLANLVAAGTIDAERAQRFGAEYARLHTAYAKQLGEVAAQDLATRETMDALEFQALTERRQKTMQIRTQQELLGSLQAHVEAGGSAKQFAVAVMDHHENVAGVASVDNTRGAIARLAWSRMGDFLQRYSRDLLGQVRNAPELVDVVRALRGEAVENANARETAAAIGDTMEWLRQQFNAAGGAIPRLEGWGLPQSHDALEIARAGYVEWRGFIADRLDWQRMVDQTTGRPFASPEALEPALEQAWRNISSNGMDSAVPGAFSGSGKVANRHTDHRFFVFKDADSWLEYNDRFGTGDVFDAVTGHIESMARDIAAMRVLGPNPAHTVGWLSDMMRKDAMPTIEGGRQVKLAGDAQKGATVLDDMWDYYSGEMTRIAPENRAMARRFSGVRNWNVMSKLGSAFVSAVATDPMFAGMTARFNGLPVMDQVGGYLRGFNPADASHREAALHAGLVFSEMTGRAERIHTAGGGTNLHELTRRGADFVMRTSLLSPHTVAAKQSIGLSFMKDWAEHAGEAFDGLAEPKRLALERYGIGAEDWDRLRAVGAVQQGDIALLRPGDLARTGDAAALDSAVKFMSLIDAETKFGVPGESLRAQAAVATLGHSTRIRRGTIGGELVHSATQFKTYSVIWMMTHLERALYGRGGISRLEYALTLPVFLTLGGFIANALIDISRGEVPSDKFDATTFGRAVVRGGGLGVLGDIASAGLNGESGSSGPVTGFLVGPTLGAIADPVVATIGGNIGKAAGQEKTHFSSEALRVFRTNLPGSNAWYARVAVNRLVLDQLQQLADPNYRQSWRRMERQAAQRGSRFWWHPGQTEPQFLQENAQ